MSTQDIKFPQLQRGGVKSGSDFSSDSFSLLDTNNLSNDVTNSNKNSSGGNGLNTSGSNHSHITTTKDSLDFSSKYTLPKSESDFSKSSSQTSKKKAARLSDSNLTNKKKEEDEESKPNKNNKSESERNPFKMPKDEEIFVMRDEERKRNIEQRERARGMKIYEKATATYKNSSTSRVDDEVNDVASSASKLSMSLPNESALVSKYDTRKGKRNSENLTAFVASKREMFLMSYSLAVKRDEMKKLANIAADREDALKKAEKILEDDASRFDAFLKENNIKTMEATKRADAETKAKLDKVQEIKRYTQQIGAIKNEMAKYDEQLEDCKKYKDFLDKLTPPEWFEEIKQQQQQTQTSSPGDDQDNYTPMYFTKPQQLLAIFKSLEESNMFLIQNSQETEKVLEELRQNLKETEKKMEIETNNLKSQIVVLEESIEREEARWRELEEKALRNFGMINSTSQEVILQDLHEKVADVYNAVVGDSNIEHYMEELFKQRNNLPASYLATAVKAKEKEHRIRQRMEKMEKQKFAQEQRIKKSLERSQAPIKKRDTKPVMFRSMLQKETKEKQETMEIEQNKEEEELRYFGLL